MFAMATNLPPPPPPLSEEEVTAMRNHRCAQFKIDHPPPTIASGTVLQEGPRMLLRQRACQYNSYDISEIIKQIKKNHCDYKTRFVEELARNKRLRDELESNAMFDEWITQSKNYIIPTNYNSKY
tara:strand:- start:87 stop:461 length:375 start_codon:yes stop_codon:yes gene_type:complete